MGSKRISNYTSKPSSCLICVCCHGGLLIALNLASNFGRTIFGWVGLVLASKTSPTGPNYVDQTWSGRTDFFPGPIFSLQLKRHYLKRLTPKAITGCYIITMGLVKSLNLDLLCYMVNSCLKSFSEITHFLILICLSVKGLQLKQRTAPLDGNLEFMTNYSLFFVQPSCKPGSTRLSFTGTYGYSM